MRTIQRFVPLALTALVLAIVALQAGEHYEEAWPGVCALILGACIYNYGRRGTPGANWGCTAVTAIILFGAYFIAMKFDESYPLWIGGIATLFLWSKVERDVR